MKYSIVTFGCRVNQADSLTIDDRLRASGAVHASTDDADLVVVNTCSVTASADQGARQTIRRIARANPSVRIVVTGCYATRRPDEVGQLPNVTRVVSNADKDALLAQMPDSDGPCGHTLHPGVAGRTALTLRVQTGCDEQCSYCIIPRTRGEGRSRPLPAVIADIARGVDAGYREIVITGVHLGSYGRDLGGGVTLTTLMRTLAAWDADVLFRISSLEPMDCTPEIIDLAAQSSRIAPHFHLPLQHAADRVLRAMRRPYTAAYYRDLVERIRGAIPHAAIGSDIIVGFPGEDETDFGHLRSALEQLPLTQLHVFPYSDRPGTDASAMSGKVDGIDIRERGRHVRELGQRLAAAFRASQAGSRRRALTVDDGWSAVTDNYFKVRLPQQLPRNTWTQVVV